MVDLKYINWEAGQNGSPHKPKTQDRTGAATGIDSWDEPWPPRRNSTADTSGSPWAVDLLAGYEWMLAEFVIAPILAGSSFGVFESFWTLGGRIQALGKKAILGDITTKKGQFEGLYGVW